MTLLDAKRKFVIDTATDLFLERSIGAVTVKDIAVASGLGEATVYRYFSGKGELLVACALGLQEEVVKMFTVEGESLGFEGIERFYTAYLDTFRERPSLYRFLSEFDAYCINGGVDLEKYADNIDRFKEAFKAAYEQGLKDHTLRTDVPENEMFWATMHLMLAVVTRYAVGLAFKGALEPEEELRLQKKMLLREFVQ